MGEYPQTTGGDAGLAVLEILVYWHDQDGSRIDESWWDEARSAVAAAKERAPEIVLDDSVLLTAAEALERELTVLRAHLMNDDEAPDAVGVLEDTIARLRGALRSAAAGAVSREGSLWPAARAWIQAVAPKTEEDA